MAATESDDIAEDVYGPAFDVLGTPEWTAPVVAPNHEMGMGGPKVVPQGWTKDQMPGMYDYHADA